VDRNLNCFAAQMAQAQEALGGLKSWDQLSKPGAVCRGGGDFGPLICDHCAKGGAE
jgi:hypothetical protein